ncbi:MAG TPA: VCBS repeat-containing protein [Draconibacterium sp.]|nr:VCBS repeat-containing protein [Draconibacterium sp.]
MKKLICFSTVLILIPVLLMIFSFKFNEPSGANSAIYSNNEASGKELALVYCKICHLFPEPALLDKKTWTTSVLPNMGLRLGIKQKDKDPYESLDSIDMEIVKRLNIYPETPLIMKEDWDKIVAYYKNEAPSVLPKPKTDAVENNSKMPFTPRYISIGDPGFPMVTMLGFNDYTKELYIGDFDNLYALNSSWELTGQWKLNSPATHIEFQKSRPPLVLTIGHFGPSDQNLGILSVLYPSDDQSQNVYIDNLKRPVYFVTGDLNGDNKRDVVVCNFGNYQGKLSWFDDCDAQKEHVLSLLPGARNAVIKDLNHDGKPDVIALMAQAYEKVSVFRNKGNNVFEEEPLIEFPPVYGVSYFELADINNDGYDDILVSNGDNWDLSAIDKPYHGFRIYLNDGKNKFRESFFFPMYGCSKVMTGDFDKDGDLDIVAISFYAQLRNPGHSFVYLQNNGNLNFSKSYLPEAKDGKWLTMDVADINNDGFPDVLLGSFIYNINEMSKAITASGQTDFPQVLLLTQNP